MRGASVSARVWWRVLRLVRPRVASVRLSRFAVWRFEALWEYWWHVGALAA